MTNILTDANFEQAALKASVPVVVDFWAEWCGPCKIMSPVVDELAAELPEGKIVFAKMNVDENQATPQQYGVMSIPTFLVFKNGAVTDQIIGSMPKETFKERIMKHVS